MNADVTKVDDPAIMPMIAMVDKKSRIWPAPMVYHGVDMCKRELCHAAKYGKDVQGRPSLFCEYPQDFELWLVGRYDSRTGDIYPCKEIIAQVADVINPQE